MRSLAAGCFFCLLPALAQPPASRPSETSPRPLDAAPKPSRARQPERNAGLFERLAFQLFAQDNGVSGGVAVAVLGTTLSDFQLLLIAVVSLASITLIVEAYFLYKIYGDNRRISYALREDLRLNRQSLELARQSLLLSQPPKLTIRGVEVRPRPYTSGDPLQVFPPDSTVECRFLVRNSGGNRATILSSAVTLYVVPHAEPLPMVSPLAGVTPNDPIIPNIQLKPGEFTFGIFIRRTTQDEIASLRDLYVLDGSIMRMTSET